jgi:hypothetical protein
MAQERAARILAGSPKRDYEPIECRECGDLLARRWPGGTIEPVVIGATFEYGRVVLLCPRCQRKVRLRQMPQAV